MSIYAFSEMEGGRVARIYASARYPSVQKGNVFYDSEITPNLRDADVLPLKIECSYSVVAFRPSHILLSRDVLGGKPLYYGSDMSFSSFKGYIEGEISEVLPGEVVKIDYSGEILERRYYSFDDVFKSETDLEFDEALERIERALLEYDCGYGCIAFSGGVDSSLLASMYDLPLLSITASRKDEEWLKHAAKLIGREVEILKVDEGDVVEAFNEVRKIIETDDFLQISIAVPIHMLMKYAKTLGYSSIVFGQSADELFGGYERYERMSYTTLRHELLKDVKEIGEKNLVRDVKVAYRNEIKLLTPYLQWDVIKLAVSIPPEMKVFRDGSRVVRKYALRRIAEKYLPKEIAWRSKKAIQYSTGISKILKKNREKLGI